MADETGTTGNTEGSTGTNTEGTSVTTGATELGDAGKKALDEERNARKTAEKQARDAQAELDKIRASSMSDQEKAVAPAKAEGRDEALKTANERLVRAEVKAAAAGKLADPGDALGLLGDLTTFIDKTGDVDTKAITSAIDELVKTKPYLSAKPGNGAGEGGARGGNANSGPSMDDWLRQQAAGRR